MSPPSVLVVRSGPRPFGSVYGAELLEYVSHTIEPLAPDPADWSGAFDTVVVTSQTAVEQIVRDAARADALRSILETASLVAVGEATAELLQLQGFSPDRVASGSARSILESLAESAAGRSVLWPSGEEASLDLVTLLRERGASVRRIVLYRKKSAAQGPGLSAEVLARRPAAFCATSPAAAEWLFDGLVREAAEHLRTTPAVALGNATLERLAALGVESVRVAPEARFRSAGTLLVRLATGPGRK
jgi:uroporphyrinogen-III synthase